MDWLNPERDLHTVSRFVANRIQLNPSRVLFDTDHMDANAPARSNSELFA